MPFSDLVGLDWNMGVDSFKSSPRDSEVQRVIPTSAKLDPATQKCGPWASSIWTPWELVRNAASQMYATSAASELHFTRSPRDSVH